MNKIKNLNRGDKIEDWIFLKETKNYHCLFKCKCGKEKEVLLYNVLSGKSKSCGCEKKHLRKGLAEITGEYWCNLKFNAAKRKIDFNLTIEYAWNLFLKQEKKCSISGLFLSFKDNDKFKSASLDRIDSSKGYVEGNIQWVSKGVNLMKWSLSQEKFISLCQKIYNNDRNK